ncbi:MAG: XdhC family protein [Rhizobiaceae bacterium]
MIQSANVLDRAHAMKQAGESFALATVVRTVSVTAAKAGAKAIIRPDGTVVEGWIGGGCARGAVLKAARDALDDGQSRLISVQPEDLLEELGVTSGDEQDGVQFARNMCPSKGTMDIFVEPVFPLPELFILGSSPVAVALAEVGPKFGFRTVACAPGNELDNFHQADDLIDGYNLPDQGKSRRFIIVSTQGRGDLDALRAALDSGADHVAFVGSRAKASSLRQKLDQEGYGDNQLARLKAPAGLDIGAITPEEIALSILAEIVTVRRRGLRDPIYNE